MSKFEEYKKLILRLPFLGEEDYESIYKSILNCNYDFCNLLHSEADLIYAFSNISNEEEKRFLEELSERARVIFNLIKELCDYDSKDLEYKEIRDLLDLIRDTYFHTILIEVVSNEGGSEGDGEYVELVIKLDKRFYKATGSYYSYHGIDDWSDFKEVRPVEKIIIVYE